jgi:LuxR family transcriptional regulator, maltose regulon positive regulatory protein
VTDSIVGERPAPAQRAAGPGFELITSKLRRPLVRSGTIRRPSLLERLTREDSRPVVSVVAPSGYGKTTLLAQWAERTGQAFAWVSVDEHDNDPKVLLSYVAQALDAVQPVSGRVFEALASPVSSVPGSVLPRLGSAFWSMTAPVVLVLDDVHLLHNRDCRDALSVLADHVPGGSRLVLAGRNEPPLRTARLRAQGRILEIGPRDLTLSREEAAKLLRSAGIMLSEKDVAALHQRTEGWPTGLYLAALYLREGGAVGTAAVSFGGAERLVSEYMESEFLERISQRDRVFLTRTAVLEQMSGPLCEAVLDQPGSAATLADLARSNLLLVPLDRRGQWYRYHHLFRDMLLAELERLEPALIPVLRRRAAGWCLRNDRREEALEYSIAAGDVDTAASLVQALAPPTHRQGRLTTLQRWYQWLDERDGIAAHPIIAIWAAYVAVDMGRPAEAERWAAMVDRWQYQDAAQPFDLPTEAWAAGLRAVLCRRGVGEMRADADEAAQKLAAANIVAPVAQLCQAMARILSGDLDGADTYLEDAVSAAEEVDAHNMLAEALSERSLLAMARGDWSQAEVLAAQASTALRRVGMETLLACTTQARLALHRGDVPAVRQHLVAAQRLRPLVTYAVPHEAVQARIELARVHLALADIAGARTLMREIGELLKRRPDLGTLVGEAQALRTQLAADHAPTIPGASTLTGAELRVLPLLTTHLSFPEIAADLFVSPHTVKSQAMSIYRKLGASSRSQAIARSRELGLLEGLRPVTGRPPLRSPGSSEPRSDQLKLAGPADRLAAALRRQLAVDAPEVGLDGVDGDVHLLGDLGRVQHARDVHEHLPLAFGERLDDQDRRLAAGVYGRRKLVLAQSRGE